MQSEPAMHSHRSLLPFGLAVPFVAFALWTNACSDAASPGGATVSPSSGADPSSASGGSSTGSPASGGATASSDDAGVIPVNPDDAGAGQSTDDASHPAVAMDAGGDAEPSEASVGDAEADASAADASVDGGDVVNGCTAADYALNDESGANGVRTIAFAMAAPAVQYKPNCMKIAKGQSVTWNGDFKLFPLAASGGTTPSPIQPTKKGTTAMFTFPAAGTYGFDSPNEAKTMFGAIEVTP